MATRRLEKTNRIIEAEVSRLGMKQVKDVGGGGCPTNKGIKISGSLESLSVGNELASLSNSVAQFGVEGLNSDEYGPLDFKCPHCGEKNTRPKGTLIKYCQNEKCGKNVSCDTGGTGHSAEQVQEGNGEPISFSTYKKQKEVKKDLSPKKQKEKKVA